MAIDEHSIIMLRRALELLQQHVSTGLVREVRASYNVDVGYGFGYHHENMPRPATLTLEVTVWDSRPMAVAYEDLKSKYHHPLVTKVDIH